MQILVGTRNPARFDRYHTILWHIPALEVCSLNEIQLDLTEIYSQYEMFLTL
ncbi:MAG: hypothetical protein ACRDHW_18485 [Ktedonobacteraceae bacterium]